MITKEYISELKRKDNTELANLIKNQRDVGTINFILESLGQLPSNFDSTFLYDLLNHQHSQVRLNAVKNIGKLNGNSDIKKLSELYKKETDTSVKREIISSFPVPNTKDDILEFLSLAFPKAKSKGNFLTKNNPEYIEHNEFVSVWKAKCEQVIMKAKFSMKDDKKALDEIMQYAKELGIK